MFIKEISVKQSAAYWVVQYEIVIWTTQINYCSCTAALFHSLCLDKNEKETIPQVVNTACVPSALFSHHSYLFF